MVQDPAVVLLSAQDIDIAQISTVAITSADRLQEGPAQLQGRRIRLFSPPTKREQLSGRLGWASNIDLVFAPTGASWLNQINAQLRAVRCLTLNRTDHRSRVEQNPMIRANVSATLG
jgi:hypothetical protein